MRRRTSERADFKRRFSVGTDLRATNHSDANLERVLILDRACERNGLLT